ncbi:MAG: phage integrase N-terminal SAM-like domain-containing protein, partial [Cyanobacteria bacterium P01_G01_bin.4]
MPEFRYFDRSNSSTKPEEAEEPQDWRWLRVEEFLRSRELADKTLKAYRRELKLFADWTPKGWHELTVRDCDRYKDYLVNRPSARGGKLSAASVNLALAALQSFLKWMVARDYMAKNPMGLVERPQLEPPRSREL